MPGHLESIVILVGGLAAILAVVALAVIPLGDYMARVFTSPISGRVERAIYRVIGVDGRAEQSWQAYLRAVLLFSAVGVVVVYALQRLQQWLPWSLGLLAPSEHLAFNTAISFVTNTNWQSYSPEQTLGYSVQFVALAVQNFVSAAVGIAVAVALIRGFAARRSATIGNFWVDLVRATYRILLPLSLIGAVVLMAGGVIQNLAGFTEVTTVTGATQTIPGGTVASQEAVKLLGTNGGGFFNANSAHRYENPNGWTNAAEIVMMLVIPFALARTFGRMVNDRRQGYAIAATMAVLFVCSSVILTLLELGGRGTAPELAGGAMEGKETRFGVVWSTLFASTSTLTSTGAVNSMHDSYTALGGMLPMLNMMIGELAPAASSPPPRARCQRTARCSSRCTSARSSSWPH